VEIFAVWMNWTSRRRAISCASWRVRHDGVMRGRHAGDHAHLSFAIFGELKLSCALPWGPAALERAVGTGGMHDAAMSGQIVPTFRKGKLTLGEALCPRESGPRYSQNAALIRKRGRLARLSTTAVT
jgi:hypothetical protein